MLDVIETALQRWLHRLAAYVVLPALVIAVMAEVISRYLLKGSLQWPHEAASFAMLALFATTLPLATRGDRHIRIDLLQHHLPPKGRALAEATASLCGLAFTGILAWQQLADAPQMLHRGDSSDVLNLPLWPAAAFVGACALIASLTLGRMVIHALQAWRRDVRR